jgi:hypothetical protein
MLTKPNHAKKVKQLDTLYQQIQSSLFPIQLNHTYIHTYTHTYILATMAPNLKQMMHLSESLVDFQLALPKEELQQQQNAALNNNTTEDDALHQYWDWHSSDRLVSAAHVVANLVAASESINMNSSTAVVVATNTNVNHDEYWAEATLPHVVNDDDIDALEQHQDMQDDSHSYWNWSHAEKATVENDSYWHGC